MCADWLVERQVIAKGSWQKTLRTAHTKLEAALEAERPPVAAATDALGPAGSRTQQGTTYFDCVKVLQALKDAGLDEKSFLGAYSNPHTARWADVVKRFESGSVFLVDAAQYLVHSCSYELPALRQEMTRAERELAELQRRQAEYVRLAEASQARFVQACSHKKISASAEDSAGLSDELRLSLSQLRPLYEAVARRVQQEPLPKGVQEYKEIVGFALDKTEPPPADPQAAGAAAGAAAGKKGGGGGKKGKGKAVAAVEAEVEEEAVAAVVGGGAGGVAGKDAPLLTMLTRVQSLDVSTLAMATGGGHSTRKK